MKLSTFNQSTTFKINMFKTLILLGHFLNSPRVLVFPEHWLGTTELDDNLMFCNFWMVTVLCCFN